MADNKLSENNISTQVETIEKVAYSSYHNFPSKGIFLFIKAVKDDKTVVLKTLKAEYRDRIALRNALKKEFKTCMNLSHPNVVRYNRLVETDEYGICIELEYVEGMTLKSYLLEGHIDDDKIALVNQIASALQYVHSQGVIHRNLNTSNIIIAKQGNIAKITDFGVLTVEELKPSSDAMRFIAPELKDETMSADASADIYSLGTIMKSMGLTLTYSEHIKRCCAFKRSERYTDIDEFLADFNNEKSSISMPKISVGIIKILGIAIVFVGIIAAIFLFKDTIANQFGKLNPSALFTSDEGQATADTAKVEEIAKDSVAVDAAPAVGKLAFLNTMKPALYKDLDGIFSKFEGKAMDITTKTKLNARIKAYYKGLIAANDTLNNEQRLALDNVFGEYVKAKKAALK